MENPHPDVLKRIHAIRRELVILRRIGHPQREAINAMLRPQSPFFCDEVQLFVRDTRDHIAQIVELIDSSREMASDLADAYLSNVSHRSNEIMKVLTLMASIFIPLTFIAGVYGMNFEYIPELSVRSAYFIVWGSHDSNRDLHDSLVQTSRLDWYLQTAARGLVSAAFCVTLHARAATRDMTERMFTWI